MCIRYSVITDAAQGQVGISNLPEVQVEAECMWRRDGVETFSRFYEEQASAAFESAGGVGAYITEYVGQPTGCDPCTAVGPLDGEVMAAPGHRRDPGQVGPHPPTGGRTTAARRPDA